MLEVYEPAHTTAVPMEMLQVATAQYAGWEKLPNREEILDRGIVEEAPECAFEIQQGHMDKLALELADMQWYISERARLDGYSMSVICGPGVETIDDFQQQAVKERDISPIWIRPGEALNPDAEPVAVLSLLALRVADAKTMTEERLWRGHDKGIPVHRLLRDLYSHVAIVADSYGFTLSYLLEKNMEKLSARQRASHVLEDHKVTPVSEVAENPEIVEQRAREAYAKKVARQREAIGGAIHHLLLVEDFLPEQQQEEAA